MARLGGDFAIFCQLKPAGKKPMRDDLGGDWGRMLLHVGGVIEPLAAYCEAMRGCVAALVILPQVGRC
jgi:hypothetical protein